MIDFLANEMKDNENISVVRLTTSMWSDKRGLYQKKSIIFLRKKSIGENILQFDIDACSAEDTFPKIINMDECNDGIYQIITCNEKRDYETGYIDDYDFKLIPYKTITNE